MYALLSRTGNWARNSAGSGIRAILVAVDELTLEHLAGRVARQLVEEHDLARDLVAGQVLADVVTDLVAGELGRRPGAPRTPSAADRSARPRRRSPPPRRSPRGRPAAPRPRPGTRSR